MRTILTETETYDDLGRRWLVKLLGPTDNPGRHPANAALVLVELTFDGSEDDDLYGSEPLRFPLFGLDLTPLAIGQLRARAGGG